MSARPIPGMSDVAVERSVIAALMFDPTSWSRVPSNLAVRDFTDPRLAGVFTAMQMLHADGSPTDLLSVSQALSASKKLRSIGGMTFLSGVGDAVSSGAHVAHHAEVLMELTRKRTVAESASALVRGEATDADLARMETALDDLRNGKSGSTVEPVITRLSDVEPEPVSWLWEPFIPFGKLTGLEGDPGVGKTTLVLAIAATVTRGADFHGETKREREPRRVLILSAEDGLADTLRPRLDAAGADCDLVFALEGQKRRGERDKIQPLTLSDLDALERACEIHKPALVMVDPLQAFLGANVDAHRSNETRPVLAACARLAEKFGCALLLVRHLTKASTSKAIYRGLGSIDITAAMRSVLLAGIDPRDPTRRAMIQTKNNVAPLGGAIGYELRDGAFRWLGPVDLTAADLLAPDHGEKTSALDDAKSFLVEELRDGPRLQTEVLDDAEAAGITEKTLRRAKGAIHADAKKVGARWYWSLPESADGVSPRPAMSANGVDVDINARQDGARWSG